MALGGFQKEAVVKVSRRRDSAGEPSCLRMDDLLTGLTNQGGQVQVNDASVVVPRAHLEGTPGGKGHWEVNGRPKCHQLGICCGIHA